MAKIEWCIPDFRGWYFRPLDMIVDDLSYEVILTENGDLTLFDVPLLDAEALAIIHEFSPSVTMQQLADAAEQVNVLCIARHHAIDAAIAGHVTELMDTFGDGSIFDTWTLRHLILNCNRHSGPMIELALRLLHDPRWEWNELDRSHIRRSLELDLAALDVAPAQPKPTRGRL